MKLVPVEKADLKQFKADMQEAFQLGAVEGGCECDEEILPEKDIDRSLCAKGASAYKAVDCDGNILGGAIVVEGVESNSLDFLYVKHGVQNKGVGRFIWFEIEKRYPTAEKWITCTPCFEKRNIHFYVNVCKFRIAEYLDEFHNDGNFSEEECDPNGGMVLFEKIMPHSTEFNS